ncbi:CaiB/BaiF CoA transferase family protein [Alteromonas lipolytica]|uniref:CoA-transferase n=1 Tax=Alteromonas lipolytica TaxID=1856405 RepID=A0A1E8FBL3_9ALTE|nr:CaiB/BaiF CoA-transferase family protein [Alteromonas lipolytica]OFI33311.1 CoA-transferase [Alteromonas lipolytica]GGF60787.1 CoA transferase [Alteromonas lipolytica]
MKLSGIKVVDLSQFLPGPHLSMMMADHGADVVMIEPPTGEPTRAVGLKTDGESIWFRNIGRGKKSLSLNLKHPEAKEALLKLMDSADVVIEAFRPGVVDRLGIGYDVVSARNPGVVYCSISAYGQTGPKRLNAAHDLSIQADSGLVAVNEGADGEPASPGVPCADMASSLMALSGILMALYARHTSGKGDYLDISMQDTLVAWTPNVMGPVFAENRAPVVKDERSWGGSAMYQVYKTKDGRHLTLGGSETKFAYNLLVALNREDLYPLCQELPGPVQRPVVEFFKETFLTKTLAEWTEWFKDVNVCWAPVRDLYEAMQEEHLAVREMVVKDSEGKSHLGVPIKFAQEPGKPDFARPKQGEHNTELLADLGYDDAAIAKMVEEGGVIS